MNGVATLHYITSQLNEKIPMKTVKLSKPVAVVVAAFHAAGALMAANMVVVGTHPTSTLTATPTLHTLKAYDGRIYCGYGEWWYDDQFPAVVIASYEPVGQAFHLEFSAYTDSIGLFREIGGVLYVPSTDGSLHADFRDYSYRKDGVWRDRTPAGMYHMLDMGTVDGTDLWLVGSKDVNETLTYNHAVFRSPDHGRTWQDVTLQSPRTDGRYYWGFALGGKFYVIDTVYDGTNATRMDVGTYRHVNKATRMGSGSNEFVLGVTGWLKGNNGPVAAWLVSYDAQAWHILRSNVFDFTLVGSNLFTLELNGAARGLWLASDVTPSTASWRQLPLQNVPSNAKCMEVLNGVVYVGDTQGRLWAGRADGGTLTVNQATVTNELSDDFGRALSFDGDVLAVGAPDHSGARPLSGQVTLWQAASPGGGTWTRTAVLNPPAPSFSGWFGKKLATKDGVLAVVEAGRDLSRQYRGSNALVHVYERVGQDWTWRQSISHALAQSVAIDSGWLAVGGTNSLTLYKIDRDPGFALTSGTNFHPSRLLTGFRSLACLDLKGDLCAFGVQGDISFGGGLGEVHIYQRDGSGTWHAQQVLRSSRTIPAAPGWTYDSLPGVWHADGYSGALFAPLTSRLHSPAVTIDKAAAVQLTFNHRYSFEPGWDGGQVRVSVNGGLYTAVPLSAFSENGYNGAVFTNSTSILQGQTAFVNESSGYATGTRVTSICELGAMNPGDSVSVEFLYGADYNQRGAVPNWEIESVTLAVGGEVLRTDQFELGEGGYAVQSELPPDRFGFSLALGEGWLAVGAPRDDTVALQAGAVHLYEQTNAPDGAASFVLRQSIVSPLNQPEAAFGTSVALNGRTLLVGCPGAEIDGQSQHGAVYVFRRETNVWQAVAEISPPAASAGEFGTTVAFGSNWLAAGSRFSGSSTNVADRVTVWGFGPPGGELLASRSSHGSAFELTARGEIGASYSLQTATQLTPPDWTNLLSYTLTTPATNLAGPVDSVPQRFYRLISDAKAP